MTAPLRPARPADAPALADIFVSSWHAGYRDVLPAAVLAGLDPPGITDWLASLITDAWPRTVVVTDDTDHPLGFARYGDDPDESEAGYLAALYVHPAAGGTGLGRALLTHVLSELDGRTITLWVFTANHRARELYRRAGFRPDGTTRTDPRWPAEQMKMRRPVG